MAGSSKVPFRFVQVYHGEMLTSIGKVLYCSVMAIQSYALFNDATARNCIV